MPVRSRQSVLSPRLRLAAAVGVLVVCSLLPVRALKVFDHLAAPVSAAMAPAQHNLRNMVAWVRRRAGSVEDDPNLGRPAEVAELERQRDMLRFSLLQAQDQIRLLQRVIADLSHSVELNPGYRLRMVNAPVIGGPADLTSKVLTIRAGREQGVEVNSVAVVRGVHLVGAVRTVGQRSCSVLPITDRSHPVLQGVVMIPEGAGSAGAGAGGERRGPACLLKPDGTGDLVGPVQEDASLRDPVTAAMPVIEPGMTVRLADRDWPAGAQMLIVGIVTAVEPLPNQPLRQQVTVRPVHDLSRTREVTIRSLVLADASTAPPSQAPAEGGTP